ncbi:cytochrome B [Hydrococcus rivularis NIES-593]|uniref:Cytochrome B n=1 Tax=Hydrococcus rivularis NIES-593 TaxID=1921803 RepID=A0A1U7HKU2_9CYAN|nr:cytochrome b/b6 domain-containing protein [Hydrococcus rivularis]OKH24174.1 cytochrome B [Hydrococcus rivularis NIES-593]
MSRSRPYQPLLLRILHGFNALIAVLAIITSFWVYNTYDGRLIRIALPKINDIIGIHGTFGLTFLLIMPALAIYSFHWGQKRLVQADSLAKLTQVGKPIWWYTLHRIVNTVMLIAATLALITGRQMKEEWLPAGELHHTWYQLHLLGWVILTCCLFIHLLMSVKVGGIALIVSMFEWQHTPEDSPRLWWQKVRSLLHREKP